MIWPWVYHEFTMIWPWVYHEFTMIWPWVYHEFTMIWPWVYHEFTMIWPWVYHEFTMIWPWVYHEFTMIWPWANHDLTKLTMSWLWAWALSLSFELWVRALKEVTPKRNITQVFLKCFSRHLKLLLSTKSLRHSPPHTHHDNWWHYYRLYLRLSPANRLVLRTDGPRHAARSSTYLWASPSQQTESSGQT